MAEGFRFSGNMCKNGHRYRHSGWILVLEAGEKATAAITDALWRLMRSRGWGTISQVERALGMPRKKLHKARTRGMRLSEVMDVLAALDHPPGPFFASIFGDGPTTAGDRFRAEGSDLIARGIVDLPELASPTLPDTLSDVELDALDRLRFDDPKHAADQARGLAFLAASEGRQGDASACAGRWGSALRACELWHPAHAVVTWAINHAPQRPILADCWLRAGSIVSDHGRFEDAAELARVAMLAFVEMGDDTGVGKALVSRGIFLRRGGKHRDAIQCLQSGVKYLPPEIKHGHFAAYLNVGYAYVSSGDLGSAESCAEQAAAFEVPSPFAVDLVLLRARIANGQGETDTAICLYRQAVDALQGSPGNCALAACDLCRVYLVAGRTAEAVTTALEMARHAMPSATNRVVASAVVDLYRSAQNGVVSLGLVDRVRARIRRGLDGRAVGFQRRPARPSP